jgi:hypothetical protein
MNRLFSFGSAVMLAVMSGCGGGTTLDHDSAVKVMSSALSATASADAKVTASSGNGAIDITVTNPKGTGSVHVVGTAAKANGALSTTLDITFDKWADAETGITLDGALHEDGSLAVPLPVSGNVNLVGNLAASGTVSGSVDFDVKGSYSPSGLNVDGHVGGQSIQITIKL